ncbi:MAG TPA: hypothetical protein VF202_07505 [Trueperaceae bacterium]
MITWVDALLVVVVAVFAAAGAHRKLIGLFVGLGAALAVGPLLRIGQSNPWAAVAAAALGGLVLGLIGRRLYDPGRGPDWPYQLLGGVGGGVLGIALALALVTSLPLQRNPANPAEIFYPPRNLPGGVSATLQSSPLISLGRTILFYPLLPQEQFSATQQRAYAALHEWLVVGEPWSRQ